MTIVPFLTLCSNFIEDLRGLKSRKPSSHYSGHILLQICRQSCWSFPQDLSFRDEPLAGCSRLSVPLVVHENISAICLFCRQGVKFHTDYFATCSSYREAVSLICSIKKTCLCYISAKQRTYNLLTKLIFTFLQS